MRDFLNNIGSRLLSLWPQLLTFLLILLAGWWLSNLFVKMLLNIMKKKNVDSSAHAFICTIAGIFLKAMAVITALSVLGLDTASLIAFFGAAVVTAGFGLKDSIAQFVSGLQILVTKPFKKGDYIEVESEAGNVDEILIMNTVLHTLDNKKVIIPNNRLTTNAIINFSSEDTRRIDLNFIIGHKDNIETAKQILFRLSYENPLIFKNPAPVIGVKEHNHTGVVLTDYIWCKREDYWPLYFEMQEKVKNEFDALGIASPTDKLDVTIISP